MQFYRQTYPLHTLSRGNYVHDESTEIFSDLINDKLLILHVRLLDTYHGITLYICITRSEQVWHEA